MSEKFISYDNLKQYDEFLDKELQDIKQHVDEGFTFNVKYAESDEIGGAAIKAISDETGENIAEHFNNIENDIAINKTTLGYQKKNLLKVTASTQTKNGITFTVNSDGTITVNGTATADAVFYLADYQKLVYGTKYILSGCPEGGSATKYRLYIMSRTDWSLTAADVGNSTLFTASDSEYFSVRLTVYNGTTVNNLIFKPMIRYADITNDTYESYVDDVDTRITENKSDIKINKTTLGYQKKNLMKLAHAPGYSQSNAEKTVNWTFNSDYSISMIVTTALTSGKSLEHSRITLQPGTYIYSVEGYSTPSITHTQLYKMNADGSGTFISNLLAIENTITVTEETTYSFRAYRNAAVTVGVTEKIYPMLRYADITDDTFEPYIDDVDTRITENKSDIKINETTLGYTKKNLLNIGLKTQTINGVTFTINSNKTITVNGTATADANFYLDTNVEKLAADNYICTGCPSGGNASSGYSMYWGLTNSFDIGNGYNCKNTAPSTPRIIVRSGCTVNNLVFKPMIRYADITDGTFEPYVKSVKERLDSQLLLYSNTSVSDSGLTVKISNLFVNYSAIICNVVSSSGRYTQVLPLKYIKSLGTETYYEAESILYYYVDDSNLTIRTGLGQSNPTMTQVYIVGLY